MLETELRIQLLRLAIGDQADIRALRDVRLDELHDLAHDALAQALALVRGQHGDIGHLEEAAAIADDAAHAHHLVAQQHLHGKQGVGQALGCRLRAFRAQAGGNAQQLVGGDGGNGQADGVGRCCGQGALLCNMDGMTIIGGTLYSPRAMLFAPLLRYGGVIPLFVESTPCPQDLPPPSCPL